jgi:hypothetical protein
MMPPYDLCERVDGGRIMLDESVFIESDSGNA